MAKTLLIVESPSKARTIGKYLGPGYIVRASLGHVRDLPRRTLGVEHAGQVRDVDPDLVPHSSSPYQVSKLSPLTCS